MLNGPGFHTSSTQHRHAGSQEAFEPLCRVPAVTTVALRSCRACTKASAALLRDSGAAENPATPIPDVSLHQSPLNPKPRASDSDLYHVRRAAKDPRAVDCSLEVRILWESKGKMNLNRIGTPNPKPKNLKPKPLYD